MYLQLFYYVPKHILSNLGSTLNQSDWKRVSDNYIEIIAGLSLNLNHICAIKKNTAYCLMTLSDL